MILSSIPNFFFSLLLLLAPESRSARQFQVARPALTLGGLGFRWGGCEASLVGMEKEEKITWKEHKEGTKIGKDGDGKVLNPPRLKVCIAREGAHNAATRPSDTKVGKTKESKAEQRKW